MLHIAKDTILNRKNLLLSTRLAMPGETDTGLETNRATPTTALSRRSIPFNMLENRDIFYKNNNDFFNPFKNLEYNPVIVRRLGHFGTQDMGTFVFTGNMQAIMLLPGVYYIELFGASGEGGAPIGGTHGSRRGRGGYSRGILTLEEGRIFYVYIGSAGGKQSLGGPQNMLAGGWNGGGASDFSGSYFGGPGGGATDIRLTSGNWNDIRSLRSRIMVAGGGGGADDWDGMGINRVGAGAGGTLGGSNDGTGGNGGGLEGTNGLTDGWDNGQIPRGTQTSGYAFGIGGDIRVNNDAGGGGGGYYGGYGSNHNNGGGAGGSGFISGHPGCNAIRDEDSTVHTGQPVHYSGVFFTETYMETGVNDGDGYAKFALIKRLEKT